jgi:hypothetical protein
VRDFIEQEISLAARFNYFRNPFLYPVGTGFGCHSINRELERKG